MTKLYPLTLKLTGKNVLVVGAGRVALRKIQGLLGTGAQITVVAPKVLPEIAALEEVTVIERLFEGTDTQDAHIVYAATDDPEVNDEVGRHIQHWQWFNDTAASKNSNFFTPAVVRNNGLIVSIATDARNPTQAKLFKQKITEFLLRSKDE